jgi:predicted transcriptional regulator
VDNSIHSRASERAESVTLDEDVQEELRKLAQRSGRPLEVLANAALRDYVRYEKSRSSAASLTSMRAAVARQKRS